MKRLLLFLPLCLILLLSCEEMDTAQPDKEVLMNTSFSLRPPQQAHASGIRLTVLQVADSRCPADVQCIWEGEVTVKLRAQTNFTTKEISLTLHRPDQDGKNTAVVGNYRITLESVSMPPSQKVQWKTEDYDLRLLISNL